jgi:hypothetical protein
MKKVVSFVTTASLLLSAVPALADVNSSFIKIETSNTGSIENHTSAKSETGGNWAGGSRGGRGGSGGDVEVDGSGDYNNGGAVAGDGGTGGNSDIGGTVSTGNADAHATTENTLNDTFVDMDLYGEDVNSSKIKVLTSNYSDNCECDDSNVIDNRTKARARTGDNDADGSKGGKGGSGGDVEASTGDNNNGGSEAGWGGNGGSSSDGGWIETGAATSNASAVNVLNATLVRVRL